MIKKSIISIVLIAGIIGLFYGDAFAVRKYIVQKGDTLGKIAKNELGDFTLWKKVMEWNNIENPNLIQVGQEIILEEGAAVLPARSTQKVSSTQEEIETLRQIRISLESDLENEKRTRMAIQEELEQMRAQVDSASNSNQQYIDQVNNLKKELDELQAENAKLNSEVKQKAEEDQKDADSKTRRKGIMTFLASVVVIGALAQ
jgi:LysM repeat protein